MRRDTSCTRRAFLKTTGCALPLALATPGALAAAAGGTHGGISPRLSRRRARELQADLVIIGGGLGGCAAALAAARNGLRVILTEETDWIGGQLTTQAVPPDENPWIETFGGTKSYQELRTRIRDYYRRNYPLTPAARANAQLNPGGGNVSRLCHEPRVALAVLQEMLAPWIAGGKVRLLLRHRAMAAEVHGDRVGAISVRSAESDHELVLRAPWFVDATETGDLLPLTRTEYVTGAESQAETGELHAKPRAEPHNHQAFTVCFPMEYVHGQDHTIEPPREWRFWREFVPKLTPPWPGRLLSLEYSHPITLQPRNIGFDPVKREGLFRYRQIVDRTNFVEGTYDGDVTLVNWPQNDYLLGNLYEVSAAEAARHLERAKQLSLSLLYWLQTEAPRPDGGTGWKGLRLRPDLVGTEDGLAKAPYIRESRRIRAEFTVLEQHVGADARAAWLGRPKTELRAEIFPDSVGIGYYRIDLHPSTGGDNYIDVASYPFQIPLGALLPRRVENLLPACKNIGTTHITNGCYRLHPVEWNIGEAVGALAAFCAMHKRQAREVRQKRDLLEQFQAMLRDQGVPLRWPDDLKFSVG
ncbi:MAG: FAD-dependent oxidoreductase [Verrucomicrobiae bacterium]|nr:FAD-dependent oxidoreductase [Verrucomicrobiae bacterium]